MAHEFIPVTPSNVTTHSALTTLGNRGALVQAAPVTATEGWGQIRIRPYTSTLVYTVEVSAGFTGNRSIVVSLHYLGATFTLQNKILVTLTASNMAAAGRHVFEITGIDIPVGRGYQITTAYTAGTGGGSPMLCHYLNTV